MRGRGSYEWEYGMMIKCYVLFETSQIKPMLLYHVNKIRIKKKTLKIDQYLNIYIIDKP